MERSRFFIFIGVVLVLILLALYVVFFGSATEDVATRGGGFPLNGDSRAVDGRDSSGFGVYNPRGTSTNEGGLLITGGSNGSYRYGYGNSESPGRGLVGGSTGGGSGQAGTGNTNSSSTAGGVYGGGGGNSFTFPSIFPIRGVYTSSSSSSGGTRTGGSTGDSGGSASSGSGGGDDDFVRVNEETGDIWVGDQHFNFRDPATYGNTSDVVGDPDNMNLGRGIGNLIGALTGNPAFGDMLGVALGSNLVEGFQLSDFGITMENGIPSVNGMNPIELDSFFENDSGGSGGQGNGYFGGSVFAMPCTCTEGNSVFFVTSPEQYAGTYLYTPDANAFNNQKSVGFFSVLGSYDENVTGECEMYVVEDCVEIEIEKGQLNADPGYGSS